MGDAPDDLYTLRNLFWMGGFQLAINEANGMRNTAAALLNEKKEYLYRSYLALGQHDILLGEITSESPAALKGVKLLAEVELNSTSREGAIAQMTDWLSNSDDGEASLKLFISMLYAAENNTKESLKIVLGSSNMEHQAMIVQLLIKMDRADLAQKTLQKMKATDEDSTLTQLASAWVHIATGKPLEACYIYDELSDKHGPSPMLLNGLAGAKMHCGEYAEAETLLQESLSKSAGDAETLANLIVVSQHLRRSEDVVNRYVKQLQSKHPQHQLVEALATFEGAFDRVAATMAK